MPALSVTAPTLLDLANRMGPGGTIPQVVELLTQTNEVLEDMVWLEGNTTTGHKTKIRTGLPTPTWRRLNAGVAATKGTTADVTVTCGLLEDRSEVDQELVNLETNKEAFRLSEDMAHLEGMNQSMAQTIFYGNEAVNPERFTGIASYYNLKSAPSGASIIDAGGVGADNTSIFLIGWGPNSCHGVVPKGTVAGIEHEDLGVQSVDRPLSDGSGVGKMQALVSRWVWRGGIVVKDWRYVVRIANIDKSDLTKNAVTGADLIDLMTQASELLPAGAQRPAFYMSKTMKSFIRRQIANKTLNSTLTDDMVSGKRITAFDGIPVRRVDAMSLDEARVL